MLPAPAAPEGKISKFDIIPFSPKGGKNKLFTVRRTDAHRDARRHTATDARRHTDAKTQTHRDARQQEGNSKVRPQLLSEDPVTP